MSLESKVNEPIKRYRGRSRISNLALAAIFAIGSAFLTKGCDSDSGGSSPVSYEGVWELNWDYSRYSCTISGGPAPVAITSANGGNFNSGLIPLTCTGAHTKLYGRVTGNMDLSSGIISGTYQGSDVGGYHCDTISFAGQCDSPIYGHVSGTYFFTMTLDKQ